MSTETTEGDVPLHLIRAEEHLRDAKSISSVSENWAKVAAFYSAYHCMKAAILQDPAFMDAAKLAGASPYLTFASRLAEHHNGHIKADRGPGINDIVRFLYRPYYSRYLQLHTASISVRYKAAETIITVQECIQSAEEIGVALSEGTLVYKI